jgi:hypothetical protein
MNLNCRSSLRDVPSQAPYLISKRAKLKRRDNVLISIRPYNLQNILAGPVLGHFSIRIAVSTLVDLFGIYPKHYSVDSVSTGYRIKPGHLTRVATVQLLPNRPMMPSESLADPHPD